MSQVQLLLGALWIFSFAASLGASFFKLKSANRTSYALAFAAFVFAGLRPDSFPDYYEYIQIISSAQSGNFSDPMYWAVHGEPGFKILIYILSSISDSYQFIFFSISMLTYVFIVMLTRELSLKFAVVWFFYLSFFFITRDLGQIRLSLASILIAYAMTRDSFTKAIIFGGVSSLLFQYLSVFVVFFIFIFKAFKFNNKTAVLIIFTTIILSYYVNFDIISNVFNSKLIENYEGTSYVSLDDAGNMLPMLRNAIVFIIIFWYLKDFSAIKTFNVYIWASFFSFVSYIIFMDIPILSQRMAAYFGSIIPFAFANVMTLAKSKLTKHIAIYGTALSVFILTLINSSYLN